MFYYDKFIDELKELVLKRSSLQARIKELNVSVRNGQSYFAVRRDKAITSSTAEELLKGTERMLEITNEIIDLEHQIFDLDTIIVSKLEIYMSNFEGKFSMPSRMNDAGDIISYDNVYATAIKSEDRREVTPDDIWFLKMIKDAFKATNVSFIEK